MLRLCGEGSFERADVDYKLTGAVYNLCYWIGDRESYIYLPGDVIGLAVIDYNGKYRVYSENCTDAKKLRSRLEFVIGLNEDIDSFHHLARRDPLLGGFTETYSGWRLRSTSLWWGLVTGICQQNASFKQGWRILHNIVKNYDKRIVVDGKEILRPPDPVEVLENSEKLLASGAGFRVRVILNTAKAIANSSLDLKYIEKAPVVEAEKELRKIRGVGYYTARLALALATRKYELPPVDRWLRKIASVAYGIDEHLVEKYWIEKWGRWAALAAIAVTIALDAEPLTTALERIRKHELSPKPSARPSPFNMAMFCKTT